MQTVTTNGVTLAYDTHGDPKDEPILLIMGLGMQLTAWKETFTQGLADMGYYVIRLDNRDCGLSTKMDQFGMPNLPLAMTKWLFHMPISSPYSLNDMAKDAIGLMDELNIDAAHVVGASMGGMIAHIMAADFPDRVLSVTSIMSTSGRRGLPGPSAEARKALFSHPSSSSDIEKVIEHYTRNFHIIASPRYPTPEPVVRERIRSSLLRNVCPQGAARQLLAVIAARHHVDVLKKIKHRTLVIHGVEDPLAPIECGRDTARLIDGATLREIDGMGHDLPSSLDTVFQAMINAHCTGQQIPEAPQLRKK